MQRRWQLTATAFERFLRTLDPDRDRAAVAYEALRERISGLFEWWGAPRAAELADETLDRVARKVEEGAVIAEGSLGAYVRGVARLVFYESTRERTDQLSDGELAAESASDDSEPALACLDHCLDTLPANDRTLVLRYYEGGRRADARQLLADENGVSMTALRIRTHRLRRKLEQCVTSCLAQA
jgi:DNA-directed RNA polymerase specialized sigma24 family protein